MTAAGLVGRDEELAAINELLSRRSVGGLLLSGEPGIGKTVLWEAGVAEARAAGWTVLEHRSAQAEAGLAFTGLSDLLEDVFDEVADTLAPPRRRALEVALLITEPGDAPPDARALGLALRDVIRELASRSPVLVALDDVQWLDPSSTSVVLLALRRTGDSSVAVMATRRTQAGRSGGVDPFDGQLRRIVIPPLSRTAMDALLRSALGRDLPGSTLAAIHRASGGNAFYAVELARSTPPDAGADDLRLPDSLRDLLNGRLDQLPTATQSVLLDVAALARATIGLVATDNSRLDALDAAVVEGVVTIDGSNIRFAHPLLRSIVYDRSPPGVRRSAHARLAELVTDPEERARHRALAAEDQYDTDLAVELETAGRHAAGRGATAAAAELTELAARHTPPHDGDAARSRLLTAAGFHHLAGDLSRSQLLYESILTDPRAGAQRAIALYGLAMTHRADVAERLELLEEALDLTAEDDVLGARILGFIAINRWLAGDCARGLRDARAGLERAERTGDQALLATALARAGFLELWQLEATPGLLERGLTIERALGSPLVFQDSPTFMSGMWCSQHDELDSGRRLLDAVASAAEERGDEHSRLFGMLVSINLERYAGNLDHAVRLAQTTLDLAEQMDEPQLRLLTSAFGAGALLDVGRLDEAERLAEAGSALAAVGGDRTHATVIRGILGQVAFVRGDLATAHDRLAQVPEQLVLCGHLHPGSTAWPEAIETLTAVGDLDRAADLLATFNDLAGRSNRWARSAAARCRGLLCLAQGDDDGALASFERSLEQQGGMYPLERGRTLIALGTAHRCARRHRAARETLTEAGELLESIGAHAWRERAAAELARVSGRRAPSGGLTDAERRVADLAAQGRHNKEIAATLFLAVGTVEMHLSRVYRKLGVRSRTELAGRFADGAEPAADA